MTEIQRLEAQFPWIKWREPIKLRDSRGRRRWGCRVCIARTGLKESEVHSQPLTLVEFKAHLREHTTVSA